MIVLLDNYDSFVFNLARYVSELGFQRCVKRNDQTSLEEIEALNPSHIIISPGPCAPLQAGISMDVIQYFGERRIPILGVCLGHQAIGQVYGSTVMRAKRPMHGKSSLVQHTGDGLFANLPNPLRAARYHSLIVDELHLSSMLKITARCNIGEIMALEHRYLPIFGVQFHPESVLTEMGYELINNFLKMW
jgi:anthranilate synthase/aminodeoxychorismate synthase-like glutamine amidotransferase